MRYMAGVERTARGASAKDAKRSGKWGLYLKLIVHADRGAAMTSNTVADMLDTLGVSRSFSRPRVSDDNAFSESQLC